MRRIYFSLILLMLISGCRTSQHASDYALERYEHTSNFINKEIKDDPAVAEHIAPYVTRLTNEMGRVITVAESSFMRNQPEGTLGNLISDITRSRASSELRINVDIAVLNNGGLRIPLPPGEITIGMVYELMPFDNIISVLTLSGEQVLSLADELATCGGEPISGMRMRIENGVAADVLVGSSEVSLSKNYLVATNNWLADGGGCMPTLWRPVSRQDLPILIREAIIESFGSREKISPKIDNRLRG